MSYFLEVPALYSVCFKGNLNGDELIVNTIF